MTRADWLLLLIGSSRRPAGLDPVRIQKGMFLLAQEAALPPQQRYPFRPYNYGPMSVEVYRDLDALVARGLVRRSEAKGYRWSLFAPTGRGRARIALVEQRVAAEAPLAGRRLGHIVELVDRLDFAGLLRAVYDRYPQYASRSVFRR
jgi:hypothetical protein